MDSFSETILKEESDWPSWCEQQISPKQFASLSLDVPGVETPGRVLLPLWGKDHLISPYLSADGVYPVDANLLPQSSSSFVLGRFPVLRRNSPIRSRPRGPRRRGGLGQQVSAYGAKPISAKIIVRRFDGRMAFVPEGQHDSSQARSAWLAVQRGPSGGTVELI
jgi:hypothetical protein